MTALTVDPLGRQMRPRCGKPIRNGIYWGAQVCGAPDGHHGRCLSVEAYKRYLERQREINAARHAAMGDRINHARRTRYAINRVLATVRAELDGRWPA